MKNWDIVDEYEKNLDKTTEDHARVDNGWCGWYHYDDEERKKEKWIKLDEFNKMSDEERKKLANDKYVRIDNELMPGNIHNLIKCEKDLMSAQDNNDLLTIIKYYIEGYGVNDPQKDKIIEVLNAILENYVTICDYTTTRPPTPAYYISHGLSGLYTLRTCIPCGILQKLQKWADKVNSKSYEQKSLKTEVARKIYDDMNSLEL